MNMQQHRIFILSFTLTVVMLGYGIILPILPFYIQELGASGQEMGMLTAISALMQFIFSPLWGKASDRYGRRPVLLLGVAGYGVTMLLFGLSTHLWMLFVARALNGILSSATAPTALAYIADNSPAEKRSAFIGRLGAASGVGMVLGPALGGILAGFSLSTPFFCAAGLCLLSWLLVFAFLPESARRVEQEQIGVQPPASPLQRHLFSRFNGIGVLLLLVFVVSFGMSSFQGILGLYALQRFNMQTSQVGSLWVAIGAMLIFGQGGLTGICIRHLGEQRTIRSSLLATSLAFCAMLLADDYTGLLLSTACLVLSISMLGPVLNSLISYNASQSQGGRMGLSNAAASLGRVLGPLWAGYLFDIDLRYPFGSTAFILAAALLISLRGLPAPTGEQSAKERMPVE